MLRRSPIRVSKVARQAMKTSRISSRACNPKAETLTSPHAPARQAWKPGVGVLSPQLGGKGLVVSQPGPIPTPSIALRQSTPPSQPQRQFLPGICRLEAKSDSDSPVPPASATRTPRPLARTVPRSGQLAAHVLPPPLSPCSQLPGYDTGAGGGQAGRGAFVGKEAWI